MTTRSCSRRSAEKVSRSTRTGPSGPTWTLRGSASPWIGPGGRCGVSAAAAVAKPSRRSRRYAASAGSIASPASRSQRSTPPSSSRGGSAKEGEGRACTTRSSSARSRGLRGAYGIGQPVPHRHRVTVDQPRLGLGRPHRRDARVGEPGRDVQLPPRAVEEFGVAAHLDHQVTGGEHRVLAQGEESRLPHRLRQHTRRGQYVPRLCLVHHSPPSWFSSGSRHHARHDHAIRRPVSHSHWSDAHERGCALS